MHSVPRRGSVGAELLDAVVRLNRWVTHHTDWTVPLTLAQVRALSQIDALGVAHLGDLARAERCSQPTMTVMIRRLQRLGLVQRSRDPNDGRAARISLTRHGREMLAEARNARADLVEALIAQLAASDRERLQDALQALSGLLDAAYQHTSTDKETNPS